MQKKDILILLAVIAVAVILGAVCGKLLLDNLITVPHSFWRFSSAQLSELQCWAVPLSG